MPACEIRPAPDLNPSQERKIVYQPMVLGPPLNGPETFEVIQPP